LPINIINESLLQKYHILPLKKTQQTLHIAIADPDNLLLLEDLQFQTGLQIETIIAPYDQLVMCINRLMSTKIYQNLGSNQIQTNSQNPAVTFVEQILTDAIHRHASDIHWEPLAGHYRVRMRIDGILYEITHAPINLADSITCRLKVMAQCDIA